MASDQIAKVFAVDAVQVRITRTRPCWLIIDATGRVPTMGWSDGQLSKHVHVMPPNDGIQAFDFNGRTPDTPVLNVVTPINAHVEFSNIDVANYWGLGVPLKGIRVHAASNAKTVDVLTRDKARELSATMSPEAVVSYVGESSSSPAEVPSFAEDIKPLFRERDVLVMQAIRGFNLHNYDDVKTHAEKILGRLKVNMPCDGLWPAEDIAKFEAWKDGGMPA